MSTTLDGVTEEKDRLVACPFCGGTLRGSSHVYYHWETTTTGTRHHAIALLHSECIDCGSDITTPEQSRFNKRRILETKKAFPSQ